MNLRLAVRSFFFAVVRCPRCAGGFLVRVGFRIPDDKCVGVLSSSTLSSPLPLLSSPSPLLYILPPLSCARYELGIHGSVADTIADPTRAAGFSWRYRVRAMAGLASSLNYLHRSHSPPIYHRDVKSANVVLVRLARARATDRRRSRLTGWGTT